MVTIKTSVSNNLLTDFIQIIYKTCRSEPNLSPRSKTELRKAYQEDRLLIATKDEKPVGWLMLIQYTNDVQELAAGFVLEPYRSKGIFSKLIHKGTTYAPISILVTFNKSLEQHLNKTTGFRKSSFWEIMKFSKGRFLLNRLNLERLKAIRSHFESSKPKYLLFEK